MWCAVLCMFLTAGELILWLSFTLGDASDVLYEDSEDDVRGDDGFVDFHDAEGALKEIMVDRMIDTLTAAGMLKPNLVAKLASSSKKEQFQDMLSDLIVRRSVTESFANDSVPDNGVLRPDDDNTNESYEAVNDINGRELIDKENDTHDIDASVRPLKEFIESKEIINAQNMKRPMKTLKHEYFKPITGNESTDSQEEYDLTTIAKTMSDYETTVDLLDENQANLDHDSQKTEFEISNDLDYNTVNTFQLETTDVRVTPHRTSVNTARKYKNEHLRDRDMSQMPTIASQTNVMTTTGSTLDIPAILDIIANLTFDYGENLTRRFNETFQNFQIPTCQSPETTLPSEPQLNIENSTVIAKCFVCGLTTPEIPRDAYCADAFAGDFLPLVPMDPRARGQVARYRKYCRYLDVSGVMEFPEEPRSIFGRFTGGCSVRWIDLSGVYTQRACRNRRRAHTGKHFVSKRMAKLEMALSHVDNGCIVSPMASLVPLSRGISLYARFHACVCTGNWCNQAVQNQIWRVYMIITISAFEF